jgi:hypothetical protein
MMVKEEQAARPLSHSLHPNAKLIAKENGASGFNKSNNTCDIFLLRYYLVLVGIWSIGLSTSNLDIHYNR